MGNPAVRALETEQQRAWRAEYWRLSAPFLWLFGIMMAGIIVAQLGLPATLWLSLTGLVTLVMTVLLLMRRRRVALVVGLLGIVPLMACYTTLSSGYVASDDISRYLLDERQLAAVRGQVVTTPQHRISSRGAFVNFQYFESSATRFELAVDATKVDDAWQPASGRLQLRIGSDVAEQIQTGQRIQAHGWLQPFRPASNPGELDYRAMMAQRHVHGQLNVPNAELWHELEVEVPTRKLRSHVASARRVWSGWLMDSLRRDMEAGSDELLLLEAILLGERDPALRPTYERFRTVGLAHLMAISGAHLGILMGIIWAMARLVSPGPRWTAWILLGVLVAYVFALPLRVPIVRASIMVGIFCLGYASGRIVTGIGLLSIAGIVTLLWSPTDLFTPGFQLSFGIVAALLLFTGRASHAIAPQHDTNELQHTGGWLRRRGADVLAINVVAFFTALPVVAYHFELVSPYAVLWAILALPMVAVALAVGYVKMCAGMLLPMSSSVLAWPADRSATLLLSLVESAGRLPGSAVELAGAPSPAWVFATLAVTLATFTGWFVQRKAALAMCAAVLLAWLIGSDPGVQRWVQQRLGEPTIHVHAISVGAGSAYVVQVPDATLLFDAGAQNYAGVGEMSIAPALRAIGVRRIDMAFVSHAHLDHYNGLLDVADAVPIERVLVSPQFLAEARAQPQRAPGFLLRQLERRGLEPEPIARGWREQVGQATLKLHWPDAEYTHMNPNERSLVLGIELGDGRVLMVGDAEREAVGRLRELEPELRAHVMEMPHHGEFSSSNQALFEHVQPKVLLQSSSQPSAGDRWGEWFVEREMHRLKTNQHGMLSVSITAGGELSWRTHRQPVGD